MSSFGDFIQFILGIETAYAPGPCDEPLDCHVINCQNKNFENKPIKKLLYFSIYYIVNDDAFKIAANTWRNDLNLSDSSTTDVCYISYDVKSEPQFKSAWTSIFTLANEGNYLVEKGSLFTHASDSIKNSGLEFKEIPDDPNADEYEKGEATLRLDEMKQLEILPWSKSGQLWLNGCNTAIERYGWTPAQVFADRQKVKTYGQVGFAYFSEKKETYDRFDSWGNDPLYLRAYKRSDNVRQGEESTGKAIPEKEFNPR